ncbi:MAG: iron-sulfur cluster assembly scaffold protein [Acidobacteriota bacterium]
MQAYPEKISKHLLASTHAGNVAGANAVGRGAAFSCGSAVEISMRVATPSGQVEAAGFRTSGCGFAAAAAELVCQKLAGLQLTGRSAAKKIVDLPAIVEELEPLLDERRQCIEMVVEAANAAAEDLRVHFFDEFHGEKGLICTCFGVSEDTIEQLVKTGQATDVESVAEVCRAGSACGACRMMIQEIVDEP